MSAEYEYEEPDVWCGPRDAIISNNTQSNMQTQSSTNIIHSITQTSLAEIARKREERRQQRVNLRQLREERLRRQNEDETRVALQFAEVIRIGQLEKIEQLKLEQLQLMEVTGMKFISVNKLLKLVKIAINNEDECPICMTNIDKKEKVITVCGHIFCKNCITQLTKNKCPLCRN